MMGLLASKGDLTPSDDVSGLKVKVIGGLWNLDLKELRSSILMTKTGSSQKNVDDKHLHEDSTALSSQMQLLVAIFVNEQPGNGLDLQSPAFPAKLWSMGPRKFREGRERAVTRSAVHLMPLQLPEQASEVVQLHFLPSVLLYADGVFLMNVGDLNGLDTVQNEYYPTAINHGSVSMVLEAAVSLISLYKTFQFPDPDPVNSNTIEELSSSDFYASPELLKLISSSGFILLDRSQLFFPS
ncbi:hypothetical protein HHK36_005350 [Tetracentron sinense]|uniref:Uncharacterized protein n=1 Tax=Tetracentron sinense TaxID=13715 RepID=A0A835DMQ9_TETSI|nr:hypothetical protein HHK36_005350 [Tetracentron sinense]